MLNIYFGSQHTDREKFIFKNIKGKALLIVPDQFSLQAERDAFFYLKKKSFMDLRIVDFSSLGRKVLEQVGGERPGLIDKYGRHMLLARIISRMDKELMIYRGLGRKNSFIDMVNTMISEMKRYDISVEMLTEAVGELRENNYLKYKLTDILKIYESYQELIEGKYLDSEDYISFYGEKILQAPMVAEAEIWIYGFDTFTPKNLLVIERLLKASRGVNIVMTYEADREVFELTDYVIAYLRELAEGINEEVSVSNIDDEAYVRSTIWNRSDGRLPISLVSASNMYAEADRAAAYVLELVREKNHRFSDIVVVCNDIDVRGGILKRTFMRWGIPVFMDKKRKVLHHQAVTFVLALMESTAAGYGGDSIMSLVKSELMGFEEDDKELLENYVKEFKIRGSMWKKNFEKSGDAYDAEALNRINTLRSTVVNVVETAAARMGKYNTAEEKIRGLYDFLEKDMDIISRLETIMKHQEDMGLSESAAETAQSWNVICNIFDQMVETVGDEKISGRDLLKLMTAGFEEVEIGLVPATADSVLIGTLQRTRLSRIRTLLIVGANEGVLPLSHNDEGLLSQREKELLESMELVISRRDDIVRQEEQLAIYRALCMPQDFLYVSCCGTDEKGEAVRPSEVFTELLKLSEKKNSISYFGDLDKTGSILDMVTSRKGTLSYMADAFRQWARGREPEEEWLQVAGWYEENCSDEFRRVKSGLLFDNRINAMGEDFADSLYRGDREMLEVSASRLEKYSSCPFAHFIMYGLKAEEPRMYEVGAREIGDVYHRCLMKFSRRLSEEEVSPDYSDSLWMTITEEECQQEISDIIGQEALCYREGILASGKEEEYRAERITEICSRIAWSMVQQVRRGRIKAMKFEYPFGSGCPLPPVIVQAGGRHVMLRGIIDRLDILRGDEEGEAAAGDAVRIVDYKTGSDSIEPEYFSKGYKLQLMVYMKAALEAAQGNTQPAGVFYFKIKDMDTDADDKNVISGAEELEMRKADAYKLEGILLNDERLIASMDREIEGASHVIPVKISKKEGGYTSSAGGHLLSHEEFDQLYQQVNAQVERICGEIYSGNISIKPVRERKKDINGENRTACKYCSYRSICMFDTSFEGCRYEQL